MQPSGIWKRAARNSAWALAKENSNFCSDNRLCVHLGIAHAKRVMEPELLAHAPSCRERLLKSFASPNGAQSLPVCRSPATGRSTPRSPNRRLTWAGAAIRKSLKNEWSEGRIRTRLFTVVLGLLPDDACLGPVSPIHHDPVASSV